MKRTPMLTVATLSLAVLFASCKGGKKLDFAIPKDAGLVVHINGSSLGSKLTWKDIKSTDVFKDAYKDEEDAFKKKIMDNPAASGVDLKNDMVMFAAKRGKGGYFAFEGKLNDSKAFEKTISEMSEGKAEIEEKDGLKYTETPDGGLVSWNSDEFFVTGDASGMFNTMSSGYGNYGQRSELDADELLTITQELVDMKSSDGIQDDKRFNQLMGESGDVHLWMQSSTFMNDQIDQYLSMLKFGDLIRDNVSASTLNFDEGKITMKSKTYYNEEMTKLLEKYEGKDVDAALVNRIPSGNVLGAIAANFDPASVLGFVKAAGADGFLNTQLKEMGMKLEDVMSAMGGQFLVSFSDFQMVQSTQTIPAYYEGGQPYTYTTERPEFKLLVASSVKNRNNFQKMLDVAKESMNGNDTMVNYKLTNDWFAASNNPQLVDKFLAGGNNKHPFTDKMSGHAFSMFANVKGIVESAKKSIPEHYFGLLIATFEDMLITGDYDDGAATGDMVFSFVDKKTNALKQLFNFAVKMSEAEKKARENYIMQSMPDSTASDEVEVAPIAPPVVDEPSN